MNTVKLSGQFVVGYVEAVGQLSKTFEEQALDILANNGIEDPVPDETYSAEEFANALNETVDAIGPVTTRKIGVSVAAAVDWPDELDSVQAGFDTLVGMYQQVHINADDGEFGAYTFEETEGGQARVACTSAYPYPSSFARGVFKGTLDEFSPDTSVTSVTEVDAGPDEKCAFELSW